MPLQATSGAASYDAFGGGVPAPPPNYIEDVFSTYLYTGTGTGVTQRIAPGLDLSTKGGMVWVKNRTEVTDHEIYDTARGERKYIRSNTTDAEFDSGANSVQYKTSGWDAFAYTNELNKVMASWTFRKQAKFFDVVTYTGNGTSQTINHNLGSTPGCIITKRLDSTSNWLVYHRSISTQRIYLNNTDAATGTIGVTSVGSTSYNVSSSSELNENGGTYVAYIFAHDAGGFGLTGTDNVISCGSVTYDSTNGNTINLGYEAQFVILKSSTAVTQWYMQDTMRGMASGPDSGARLFPNLASAEDAGFIVGPTATGFNIKPSFFSNGNNVIYIAIRRGPMKVPTSGTDVFLPKTRTGNGTTGTVVTGASWPMDMLWISRRTGGGAGVGGFTDIDRLRGAYLGGNNPLLRQNQTDAESTTSQAPGFVGGQTSYDLPGGSGYGLFNTNAVTYIDYLFRRSPSVFDEVCYTGNGGGSGQVINHNLGVTPQLVIVRERAGYDWLVYSATTGTANTLFLNLTNAVVGYEFLTSPTASTIRVGAVANNDTSTYVSYLFATCASVSKVGSYTGTGTTLQIDCGFTGGARFVLIKRTDSTGAWYVWDSARGIVAGNDPYLLLNSTAAEVTNTDYVDTYSAGFEISSTAPDDINASGGSFIFLAIA